MLFYFKSCLPAISHAGRGGDHWVSPPPPAWPLRRACACMHLLFYPHVTFQLVPLTLPLSLTSLIRRFASFLYPHMWRIWSKACFCILGFLSPSLSICKLFFFFFLLYLLLPWQLLHVWQKAYGEEKGLRALSWQMSSVIMLQRRNEAFGWLPS